MPELDLDQELLSASAGFEAGNWADGAASATLDLRGGAELNRGIDLEIGVGVMALLEASFHKFLAADAQVRVEASAGLKGQIQLPMDLFGEAGIAVRLQAAAQAAARVRLSIGLSTGDFVDLAKQDPRIDGIALKLLVILLEEVKVQAGVDARVAYSAMAYANVAVTARFIEDSARGLKPGFTVGGGYGVGLKGGFGWALFAELGLVDSHRFVRRTVDALVEEVYQGLDPLLPDDLTRRFVGYLRYPAKMALRACFEIGMALAEAAPTFAGSGSGIAKQCLHVLLEEAQRALMEELSRLALDIFRRTMLELGVSPETWEASEAQREAFATKLEEMPAEPFELSAANALYWSGLATSAIDVGLALGDDAVNRPLWKEPISVLWASVHLAMMAVERMSNGEARVSALGVFSASAKVEPFVGPLPPGVAPPPVVREHINAALERQPDAVLRQDDLIEYIVRDALLETLVREVPEVKDLLNLIAGPSGDAPVAAAKTILRNLGAFVPNPDTGELDAQASLSVLAQGLRSYIDVRLKQELAPILYSATQNDPALRIYIDEVVIASMDFAVGVAFQKVIDWSVAGVGYRDALREACSSIVMKLFGRSLVVTSDVLTAFAMEQMSATVNELADHVDDPGGAAETLAGMIQVERAAIAEILEETLRICAEIMAPLSPERRATIRTLLYDLIDTAPSDPNAGWLDSLAQDAAFPDPATGQRMSQLADELGSQALDYMGQFFTRVLQKIAEVVAAEIAEIVDDLVDGVEQWVADVEDLAGELAAALRDLPAQIDALVDAANAALASAFHSLSDLIDRLQSDDMRSELETALVDQFVGAATGALESVPGYFALTSEQRGMVEDGLKEAARIGVSATMLEPMLAGVQLFGPALESLLDELVETLDEIRAVEPGADAGAEILAIMRRRMEDAARTALGGGNPGIDLDFSVHWEAPVPPVWGVVAWDYLDHWPWKVPKEWGWIEQPPLEVDFPCHLGRIEVPLDSVLSMFSQALASTSGLAALADTIASEIAEFFAGENDARVVEVELATAEIQQPMVQSIVDDAHAKDLGMEIVSPLPGSSHSGDVDVELLLENVPESFLGRGELELQRISVWVNEGELDLSAAHAEVLSDIGDDVRDDEDDAPEPRARRARKSHGDSRRPSVTRDALVSGSGSQARSTAGQRWARDRKDRAPQNHADTGRTYDPGRRLTRREREAARESLGHVLRLTLRLSADSLIQGVNTLSVAALAGGSERVERTVVFLAIDEPITEPSIRGVKRRPVAMPEPLIVRKSELGPGVQESLTSDERDTEPDPRIPLQKNDPIRRKKTNEGEAKQRAHPYLLLSKSVRRENSTESRERGETRTRKAREKVAHVVEERRSRVEQPRPRRDPKGRGHGLEEGGTAL